MISTDLLNEFKPALATAIGQLQAVLRSAKENSDSERELLQLKAAQALLSKSVLLLLDDVRMPLGLCHDIIPRLAFLL